MTKRNDIWMEHQRKRFMRPDAYRYIRPDAYRFMRPGAKTLAGQDVIRYFEPGAGASTEYEEKYDPAQPRMPAGSPNGGQWTGGINSLRQTGLPVPAPAAMSKNAICEAQWLTDILICRTVHNETCYAQAMVRLVACEKGQPIPPLNY